MDKDMQAEFKGPGKKKLYSSNVKGVTDYHLYRITEERIIEIDPNTLREIKKASA